MRFRSPHCLLTLVASGLLVASAHGDPPAARGKDAPAAWKAAELGAALPNAADRGAVTVLVWEVVEFDGVFATEERCVVIKRYAAPTAKGQVCAAGVLSRLPNGKPPEWAPGAVREFAAVPTDEDLGDLLKGHGWQSALKPDTLVLRIGGAPSGGVRYVPRVTDGGVCAAAWKTALGRAVPDQMFPELVPGASDPPQVPGGLPPWRVRPQK